MEDEERGTIKLTSIGGGYRRQGPDTKRKQIYPPSRSRYQQRQDKKDNIQFGFRALHEKEITLISIAVLLIVTFISSNVILDSNIPENIDLSSTATKRIITDINVLTPDQCMYPGHDPNEECYTNLVYSNGKNIYYQENGTQPHPCMDFINYALSPWIQEGNQHYLYNIYTEITRDLRTGLNILIELNDSVVSGFEDFTSSCINTWTENESSFNLNEKYNVIKNMEDLGQIIGNLLTERGIRIIFSLIPSRNVLDLKNTEIVLWLEPVYPMKLSHQRISFLCHFLNFDDVEQCTSDYIEFSSNLKEPNCTDSGYITLEGGARQFADLLDNEDWAVDFINGLYRSFPRYENTKIIMSNTMVHWIIHELRPTLEYIPLQKWSRYISFWTRMDYVQNHKTQQDSSSMRFVIRSQREFNRAVSKWTNDGSLYKSLWSSRDLFDEHHIEDNESKKLKAMSTNSPYYLNNIKIQEKYTQEACQIYGIFLNPTLRNYIIRTVYEPTEMEFQAFDSVFTQTINQIKIHFKKLTLESKISESSYKKLCTKLDSFSYKLYNHDGNVLRYSSSTEQNDKLFYDRVISVRKQLQREFIFITCSDFTSNLPLHMCYQSSVFYIHKGFYKQSKLTVGMEKKRENFMSSIFGFTGPILSAYIFRILYSLTQPRRDGSFQGSKISETVNSEHMTESRKKSTEVTKEEIGGKNDYGSDDGEDTERKKIIYTTVNYKDHHLPSGRSSYMKDVQKYLERHFIENSIDHKNQNSILSFEDLIKPFIKLGTYITIQSIESSSKGDFSSSSSSNVFDINHDLFIKSVLRSLFLTNMTRTEIDNVVTNDFISTYIRSIYNCKLI